VTNNFAFFVPRFPAYKAAILAKYQQVHPNLAMDPKYDEVALFSDGTKRKHNHDRQTNYSGHKRFYCYGYMATAAPDGLVVDL
jgi:hypothetical protein